MQNVRNKRGWLVSIHLFFWLLVAAIIFLIYYRLVADPKVALVASGVNVAGFLILIYGNLFFLIPQFFDQKKYGAYAFGLLLLLISSSALRFFLGWYSVQRKAWPLMEEFTPSLFGNMVVGGIFFLILSLPLRLVYNWFKKQELEQTLKTHQLEAELRFLKAQVNPHFLFNALNNIYALSFTESKQAPGMILKLSDMMSYMLYDCKSEVVPLQSEIAYLHNFLDLQQLKKEGEMQIEFEVSKTIRPCRITPMLFIPFFENAFKHGNLEDTQKGWLKAAIFEENEKLHFNISNSYQEKTSTKQAKGGVGLENIRQRLQLLYPNQHRLVIKQAQHIYSVQLQLELPA